MQLEFDFVVIGAGMAGVSAAARLSRSASVVLLEGESQPAYHSTGRSAALYSEIYGNAVIRALSRASRPFLFDPPEGFSDHPLVRPRGILYFAQQKEAGRLAQFASSIDSEIRLPALDASEARKLVPLFRDGYLGGALFEEGSADIDVSELLQGFLRECRRNGAHSHLSCPVIELSRRGGRWEVQTPLGTFSAPVVVNAAGAWGDEVARLARVAPVGLMPKRRTAVLIDVPDDAVATHWPAAIHIAESFYFKPDAGLLLLSPADESASSPCDAQPEELDVAVAVDRFEQASGHAVRRLRSSWAGLRSFVADRTPVVGFDPAAEGFFWLVGQGGYGIQTAPAMARAVAALAMGLPLPPDIAAEGVQIEALAPARATLAAA